MALDGMKRVLEIHAGWLKDWRYQLARWETGKFQLLEEGPDGRLNRDVTAQAIADLKARIAMIEEIDKHYRP